MRWIALIVAFVGGPASAQQFEIDAQVIEQCLASKPVGRYPDCIGAAAERCMATHDGGDTTVGTGACLYSEHEYWDARLNAAYSQARAKAARMDKANEGFVQGSLVTSLRDMQRAWIAYRDTTCDFERMQWGGGTGGGPATAACLMRETAEQYFDLDAFASN